MKRIFISSVTIIILSCLISGPALAKKPRQNLLFDQDVTPDVIFGSGNGNGSFTVQREGGVEVGLRIKQRFPTPAGIYNSNGDGTYTFLAGDACPGFGFASYPYCLATPVWSFDWTVNTDFEGTTGNVLSDFRYELGMDSNPENPTDFTAFDPIIPSLVAPAFDHAIGDNAGFISSDPVAYQSNINLYNVAQNSWNYEFFNNVGTSLEFFDPAVAGVYAIYLKVKSVSSGADIASVQVQVIVE